eukprot:SAG11_NODE_27_length_23309_cov_10.579362_2_plen_97_part_00
MLPISTRHAAVGLLVPKVCIVLKKSPEAMRIRILRPWPATHHPSAQRRHLTALALELLLRPLKLVMELFHLSRERVDQVPNYTVLHVYHVRSRQLW